MCGKNLATAAQAAETLRVGTFVFARQKLVAVVVALKSAGSTAARQPAYSSTRKDG